MKLLGFNFNKISIERFSNPKDKVNINTNMDIIEIKSINQEIFKSKEEFLSVKFVYNLNYEPNLAKLDLAGEMVLSLDPKLSKEVLKQWKDKKVSEGFRIALFNIILKKSTLKALQLEEELNLPTHISLPVIKPEEKKQ